MNKNLAPRIAAMSTKDFLAAMEAHEVPFAAVNDLDGFFNDPQAKSNGTYFEIQDPEYGAIRNLNFFASFDGTPLDLNGRAPRLGEHTLDVLRQFDWSESEIEALKSARAIGA
jgi:crotonobetainyl-CoA:carnitine CoA-transferase CaiB-like acyl-CoA transferase